MSREEEQQRTAEERERARLEREARRAAKRGAQPPPMPEPTPPPAPVAIEPSPPEPPPPPRPVKGSDPLSARDSRGQTPSRRRSTLLRVVLGVAVAVVLFAGWFLFSLFQPFKGDGEGLVRVAIPTGASVTQIGDILEENDVISSAFFFRTRVTLGGNRGDLKPGHYRLKQDMSYSAAIDALSEGPPKDIVTVTIPEGRSRAEVAPTVEGAGLEGSYERASATAPRGFNLRRYKAAGAESLEGFLFPATYELKRGASADELVAKQLEAFEEEFATVDLRKAARKNLTPYDVLIIASMVEREASVPEDRPLIASVIYNRLKTGMPLGIDATIRYATGNWTEPLKVSELAIDSPYNTRTNTSLPPGPIGSPGIESIKAAANPAASDYLFFVVKPCGEGEHVFSETDAEFQEDVARYNAERDRQGGQSPTDC
jgi:uncharacterized YceG family protein